MSDPVTARLAICLNMIVRNEAHIVEQALDAVAPYISSWVIVDTGSNDGTQDLIRNHMARLGIPGELYERPWRDFGHNRTEALTLAQGHGDYIWVMDADDTVVGIPDFTRLSADIYRLCMKLGDTTFWRPQLFRDGVRVRWVGVTHEYAAWDENSCVEVRLQGDYHIEDRRLSARNLSGQKHARDRDLLLAEVEQNPEDARSVFYLAQSYFNLGDFVNARKWYARRAEMGGWGEEIYVAMYQIAASMSKLGAPWPDVQDAYLRAWEFRPTRVEPLYAIARRYRVNQQYRLGYLFAKRRRNPVTRTGHFFCCRRRLRLARNRRTGGVRVLDRQACRGVHVVAAPAGPTRPPRRISAKDCGQPRHLCPDDDRNGVIVPGCAGAVPGRRSTRGRGGGQPGRRAGSGEHRAHAELVPELLPRCVAGRALPGARRGRIRPGPCDARRALRVPRILPIRPRRRAQRPPRAHPHSAPRTVLAASGRGLAILCTRELHHPPNGGAAGRSTRIPGGNQLRRRCQAHRRLRGRAGGASRTRCRSLRPHPGGGVRPGDVRYRTSRSGGRCEWHDPDPIAQLGRRAATAGLRTASLDEVLCIA